MAKVKHFLKLNDFNMMSSLIFLKEPQSLKKIIKAIKKPGHSKTEL